MKYFIILIIVFSFFVNGCDTNDENKDNDLEKVNITSLEIDDDFDYSSTKDVQIHITLLTNNDEPIEGIGFSIFNGNPEMNGNLLANFVTDSQGSVSQKITIPSSLDSLTVSGFMTTETLPIEGNSFSFQLGGISTRSIGRLLSSNKREVTFDYVEDFDSDGLPENLLTDAISADFLTRVDASLPERRPVPDYHPDYLAEGAQTNILIEELCDVWVTFLHEGAGYKNSLGFYTYTTQDGLPENVDDLNHTIFFPNASLQYSGGSMLSGDKIHLGQFEAGTVIGWFLVANGWNGNGVSTTNTRYYSDPVFNPESDPEYQQHNVLLYDQTEEKLLIGFEDLSRPHGDNDFNDAVFYVTANPPEAVDTNNINPIDIPDDADGDGISNIYDDYPDDPDRAFNFFFPSENSFGTLAYEDLWPQQGDYDLNDVIINYQFTNIHNSNIDLVGIQAQIQLAAVGGSNQNGFSIEFPWPVSAVDFYNANLEDEAPGSYPLELLASNENCVLRIIENTNDLIETPGQGVFVNTQPNENFYEPVTIFIEMYLNQSFDPEALDFSIPFNPFITINQNETIEVHLPDFPPTIYANLTYFQTEDDTSNPNIDRYYKTEKNLPWAINVPTGWNYPIEKSQITWGYFAFAPWAESNGLSYQDWYEMITEQIDDDHIYVIPGK